MLDRVIAKTLIKDAQNHALSVLIGSRQVGKSTLLNYLQNNLQSDFEYYNLENPLHLALFDGGYTEFIKQSKAKLIFIDEFQYCNNISSLFKALYDFHPNLKIFASGSSSLEIQTHLHESLAGRKITRNIYPLSYSEWLTQFRLENFPINPDDVVAPFNEIDSISKHEKFFLHFADFLQFGGMPGLLHTHSELEKREYLFEIYKTYIAKDIKSFLKNESLISFNKMITYLAVNSGTQLNKNTLSTVCGVSSRQIDRYIEVLEGTFVIATVKPLSSNLNKEVTKMPKYYFYDSGVQNAIIQDFRRRNLRSDSGAIVEQFVFWELKKSLDMRFEIKYWRTSDNKEVDFVLEKDRILLPIEVKSAWKKNKIPKGIVNFFKMYPATMSAIVLYDGTQDKISVGNRTVHFVPLYKTCRLGEIQ